MERKEHKDLEQRKDLEQTTDVLCDVCTKSTQLNHGILSANWGNGSKHEGKQYELHLCEACFFQTSSNVKKRTSGETDI